MAAASTSSVAQSTGSVECRTTVVAKGSAVKMIFSPVKLIFSLAVAIRAAASRAARNKEDCLQIALNVSNLETTLSSVGDATDPTMNPAGASALEDLHDALHRALKAVMDCQNTEALARHFNADSVFGELRQVNHTVTDRISNILIVAGLHTNMAAHQSKHPGDGGSLLRPLPQIQVQRGAPAWRRNCSHARLTSLVARPDKTEPLPRKRNRTNPPVRTCLRLTAPTRSPSLSLSPFRVRDSGGHGGALVAEESWAAAAAAEAGSTRWFLRSFAGEEEARAAGMAQTKQTAHRRPKGAALPKVACYSTGVISSSCEFNVDESVPSKMQLPEDSVDENKQVEGIDMELRLLKQEVCMLQQFAYLAAQVVGVTVAVVVTLYVWNKCMI